MIKIKRHPEFDRWINGHKDRVTRLRLETRLRKATLGNMGDIKPVGDSVFEMREHFGARLAHVLCSTWQSDYCHAGWWVISPHKRPILPRRSYLRLT